ncbi:hypothetical protein Pmani_032179 [Petrolisthes manimaculis]|uniref:Uncharacterized protein n=1 Tax=Petrolisthes manimaculis TaxID=1843537 RepID=A0AAE1TRW9_9EUCA|nr:hypothetical protein Pmani_032179 [Petrolisthes manimaculis]
MYGEMRRKRNWVRSIDGGREEGRGRWIGGGEEVRKAGGAEGWEEVRGAGGGEEVRKAGGAEGGEEVTVLKRQSSRVQLPMSRDTFCNTPREYLPQSMTPEVEGMSG